MAGLPQTLGFEGLQVQKGAHAGKSIAVFTSGGDSQGKIIFNENALNLAEVLWG